MGFFEKEINRLERRIDKIIQNPNPKMLKATRLWYEVELDLRKAQLQAFNEGKPVSDFGWRGGPLLGALGFQFMDYMGATQRLAPDDVDKFMHMCVAMDWPEDACDMTIVFLPMCSTGELPRPNLLVTTNEACGNFPYAYNALARMLDVPVFSVDIALEANNTTLAYVTGQLGELIEFAERQVPDIKFDEDKMIELQEMDRQAIGYLAEIYELKKNVPCPVSGRDAFRQTRLPSLYPHPAKLVEYYRLYRDEVKERVEKGMGIPSEEKMRLMWAVSGPYQGDQFELLESRGVAVPIWHHGASCRYYGINLPNYGDEKEYDRKLSPLEEQARMLNRQSWAGKGSRWIEDTLFVCRDQKIDGIVNFLQWGCVPTIGLAKLLAEAVEKELGIPTLQIEGRTVDTQGFDRMRFDENLMEFLDICFVKKGIR